MLKLFTSLLFFLLARLSAAQFAAYPTCVQPLLYSSFPASCLSLSLALQNTCLCQHANAFASTFVTDINQQCGCTDLEETVQLTEVYCSQVGIDIGPAFSVFIQDDTACGGGTDSGGSTSVSVGTSTLGSGDTSTGTGGGPVTVTVGSTSTGTSGGTVTVTAGGTSTGTGGAKSSDANKGLVIGQIVEIVVGVIGGILALW
jgi:hypothetical protein